MKSLSALYSGSDTQAAVDHIMSELEGAGGAPSLLVVGTSCEHDLAALQSALSGRYDCAIHGATSCHGVMTEAGHSVADTNGVGVFALVDADGDYGTAAEDFGASPQDAARTATLRALTRADRDGEIPDLIWVTASPGAEEDVLAGIRDVVGPDVPVVGGSAADNTVEGNWGVFDRDVILTSGVAVSVIFPSTQTADVFQNGYSATEHSGIVTRTSGRRIFEIDGRPAATVLNEWTEGEVIPANIDAPSAILSESTLWPLGTVTQTRDDQEEYILIHPSGVNPDQSVDVFANVAEGQRITQMRGTRDSLIARAGQVAELSRAALERDGSAVAGALVVFCGGCMLAVQDRVTDVTGNVRNSLGDVPFLGVFTFGEQGRMQTGGNLHGNLMISCVTFAA